MSDTWLMAYEHKCRDFIEQASIADVAHDIHHIERVVRVAKKLALEEAAEWAIVVPAAWLHDCFSVPKNHPDRAKASTIAADKAVEFLSDIGYPSQYHAAIHHAIRAHSFSANVSPETLEAKIVQDADRLDALGAIGVARCMQVSGALGRRLYSLNDPFCEQRQADDVTFSIDHFYKKLFHIADTLNTSAARKEGKSRENFMRDFLRQLAEEI
ncbi:MAG: HD domain-containing protein [Marinomonas sp.]|jgi:uncharacterized protein|uniref:HD domain-containing protein n=1 Tax=Marinomonas sp. TaxID=1904862 RepID=UPI003C73CB09